MSTDEATPAAPSPQPSKSKPTTFRNPKAVEGLRAKAAEYEAADAGAPGLRLCVTPKGVKSFRWYVLDGGRRRKITLGPWSLVEAPGHLTLAQAREWLEKLRAGHVGGNLATVEADLRAAIGRPRPGQAISDAPGDTVKAVAEGFYKSQIAARRKRPLEARGLLDKDILPIIGERPIAAVTVKECRDLILGVVNRPAPAWAFKVLGLLKQLFRYAEGSGYIALGFDPAARLTASALGAVVGTRSRCLDHPKLPHRDEIRTLWTALDADRAPMQIQRPDPRTGKVQTYAQRVPSLAPATRAALKILLLTGVRTGELLKARWEHLDLDADAPTWTIPVENQKLTLKQAAGAFPWVVPLAPTAVAMFRTLKLEAGASPWVMASDTSAKEGGGHYDPQSLSHALRRLQAGPAGLKLPGGPVRPHDLRRTMRTGLGKLRVPRDVRERCLNHRLGKIEDTYDVGDYLDERRDALARWDAHVQGLVNPKAAKVIAIPKAAGAAP